MIWTYVAAAVLAYVVVMFIIHEMFKKFFHMVVFIGFILFAAAMAYIAFKGI